MRKQPGFVATIDSEVVGFLTLAPSTDDALEITWMAVKQGLRRGGIGRRLIDSVVGATRDRGYPVLCVLTLGPSDPDEGYKGTRAFYRAMGFFPIKELRPENWNQPALILARPV